MSDETFPQWFRRKYDAIDPHVTRKEIAERASRYAPVSASYVIRILLHAGKSTEPEVSVDKIIALVHAVGANPQEALLTRARCSTPVEGDWIPLAHGGTIAIRGRKVSEADRGKIAAVIGAMLEDR